MYFSITLDRTRGGCVIICNEKGGVNIEEGDPRYLKTFYVPLDNELSKENVEKIIASFNLGPELHDSMEHVIYF